MWHDPTPAGQFLGAKAPLGLSISSVNPKILLKSITKYLYISHVCMYVNPK